MSNDFTQGYEAGWSAAHDDARNSERDNRSQFGRSDWYRDGWSCGYSDGSANARGYFFDQEVKSGQAFR